jgi:hypothetical protein
MNLLLYMAMAEEANMSQQNSVLCVSLDRNPRKAFGKWMHAGNILSTLRTCNEMLWILQYDHLAQLVLSRPLHPVERFAAQGLPARLGECLSKRECLVTTGNAMSVPVVGGVLSRVLRALPIATSHIPVTLQSRDEQVKLANSVKKQKLSHDIAILDRETMDLKAELRYLSQPLSHLYIKQ